MKSGDSRDLLQISAAEGALSAGQSAYSLLEQLLQLISTQHIRAQAQPAGLGQAA